MAGSSSTSSAPDPPECTGASHAGSSSSAPRDREQQHQSMDPTEYPIQSSAASVISVAPTQCDDHTALLIKLPPPRVSSDSSASINLSAPRRRSSVDPPEVLQPIDEFSSPVKDVFATSSVAAPASDSDDNETIEQMSQALALVPYDESDTPGYPSVITNELFDAESPCPPTITDSHHNALVLLRDEDKSSRPHHHRNSNRELVPYEPPLLKHDYPTRQGFDHCFISVPVKERLSALFATLRRNAERKVIVILSTWESAKFHSLLFRQLELFSVYEMHESMEETDVVYSHDRFLYTYPGVLFASDIALREFDIPPNVDYILQYEPPMHPTEYIYRFSSAKLFETSCHKALLFLSPSKEMNFMRYFQNAGVELSELQARKVSQFQPKVEKMILKHTALNEAAWRAYRAYVVAYEAHSHQDVWYKRDLDEEAILKSFANPHFHSFVASNHKEDKIVKELIHKAVKAERSAKKEESEEKVNNPQASWMRGKERSWRSGQKGSWMNKEKSWKHAHSTKGLNSSVEKR
ncbi:hypothetical protein ACHAWO_012071 [Cyclotella atomus]|uniref:ATP-dependent RNA helicase n=1 Tax=Cyclotella atomus TaxID=382360 RepID=A0ABD3NIH6_9STRA